MKKAILTLAVAAIGLYALAQTPPAKPVPATPKKIKCAVMTGSDVNIVAATKAKMFADYKGRRYFFCCEGCPEAFKANPKKFAKNASIPTPKPAKK